MRRLFSFRTTTVVLLALILSAVAYGFAAANTVDASKAGEGEGAVSGYAITNIHYTLDVSGDPGTITNVTFTTDVAVPAGGTVYVVAEDVPFTTQVASDSCTGLGTTSLSCNFSTTLTVPFIENLRVVAAQ
ncbi:MAG: hypothetical protein DRI32_06325 [Chloroflexi bacterium]|nr:MAG: hypothetical protein DRI32_06325 [Chloroflexota bacterium]